MSLSRWVRFTMVALVACLVALLLAAPSETLAAGKGKKADKKDETPEWDVENPPGKHYEVEIDTDQGTWIGLDVSPDDREIVFDLLGDIFVVPMEGGAARALTRGFAWDMQPRYSPDGKWIAFTSDRGGADNIWVMKRDGSDPRAVSSEDFRLLNSPAWSPDSRFIAARKHFTSRRSLGAGEIWLYHRSGGKGVQMNEKPNDQKDLGEPAFSPDGRHIYFSQDTTPGERFEYSKDSNGEIYTIRRMDRQTGRIEPFITGAGGAIRPTPSPDGRWLAFVRRVRFQSVLFLHDMETGRNWPVYDDLERDMQETWAVHGVYPGFAWTSDSASLVFYARGKIHRLDVDAAIEALKGWDGRDDDGARRWTLPAAELRRAGTVREIPFRVKQTHKMIEALRFPVEVAPGSFDVKMLRWVQVSPDGSRVVYQALGKLYLRDLPDGTPRRLTAQDDHDEYYPSFSRDGRHIVYTTWNDRELGQVRIAAASPGARGRVITLEPGHYVEPVFSPDGKNVAYRKTSGGFVRSPLHSRDTAIYVMPAAGGAPTLVTRDGIRPQYGKDDTRLFYMTFEEEDRRALRSIEPDGSDERTHVTSEAATGFHLSPDGRWLAFTERFNAYVTPFVLGPKPYDLGPKADSLPLRRVSRDAGEYLHWSGDGKTLHWALGPELFSRPLRDAFAFLEGAPEKLPEPPATGSHIGFSATTDVPSGSLALVGARIVTMRGDEVIENGTVVVEGNRITAVGPRGQVTVPPGARRIDVAGRTILPGLVDVHWHGSQGTEEIVPQRNWNNYASLAFGVTTAHDPSNDTSTFFAASELARAGGIVAPRLYSTGTILYGAAGSFKAEIDSLDDARSHLRRLKAVGAFSVKSYNQPRRNQRQQVITAGQELKMMVVPEGGSLLQHNLTMIVDGHTGIEHAIPVAAIYDDVVQLWSASRTGYTPTIVVGYGGIWGERYWYQNTEVWDNERLLSFVPREFVDPVARRRTMAPEEEYNHVDIARVCKKLTDAGVSVQLGAHGQREGLAAHWELWMFVQGGMTEHEALRAVTLNGAHYVGLDGDLGSIEPGKLADLIVLERNPLEDIRNSESVRSTMINGRLYDAATMDEIGNHPRPRGPFFWEDDRR